MRKVVLLSIVAIGALLSGAGTALAFNPDTLVTVGSPPGPFSQNKQNDPAVAIDASRPNILVAGSNDEIDMEACKAAADNDCPFTRGVGVWGVCRAFDSGTTWQQPTYALVRVRNCF